MRQGALKRAYDEIYRANTINWNAIPSRSMEAISRIEMSLDSIYNINSSISFCSGEVGYSLPYPNALRAYRRSRRILFLKFAH